MQLWREWIVPLPTCNATRLNYGLSWEYWCWRRAPTDETASVPVTSVLLSCESCCLHNTECLVREQRAASFELPLVLIFFKNSLFVLLSYQWPISCFFQNLNSPTQGGKGQFGSKRLTLCPDSDSVLCDLCHSPRLSFPIKDGCHTISLPHEEGWLEGLIGGAESLNH